MRRRTSLGLIAINAGLLVAIAVSCGHEIKPDTGRPDTGSSGGTTSTTTYPDECTTGTMPKDAPHDARPGYTAPRDPGVDPLVNSMTNEQKYKLLYGIPDPPNPRPGSVWEDIERNQDIELSGGKTLRGYRYRDAGRGVNLAAGQDNRVSDKSRDYSTTFPAPSIRSASWDVGLEWEVGKALGDETMASRNDMMLAPCMNIIRHPYWGRTQETYSEDMFHTGRMASALAAGIQQHVVACAKHYAANNVENNRSDQNANMDEQTLREIYGRHFEMVVREGGVGCIMAAYNAVNQKKCTQNYHLLTEMLRGPVEQGGFGFRGLVLSDWWAMPGYQKTPDVATAQKQAAEALKAGLDIEVPWALNYSQLGACFEQGSISQQDINNAAGRVLEQKFRFKSVYKEDNWGLGTAVTKLDGNAASESITNNDDHLALAEKVEIKSAVLLQNGPKDGSAPILPIKNATKIAVVGLEVDVKVSGMTQPPNTGTKLKLASQVNVGDRGSSRVNPDPAKSVDPFTGIQAAAVRAGMNKDNITTGTDVNAASGADFIVVVAGLTAGDEGEEYSLDSLGDRTTLHLSSAQESFINSVLDLDKPTVIIIESGSIVALPWVMNHRNQKQATIWAGYGGQRQGDAFGKLLFGEGGANFSGKVPLAWPKDDGDMPKFIADPSSRSTYMDYFFGYRYYDKENKNDALLYPFGWGMSYSKFEYVALAPASQPCGHANKGNVVTYVADVKNSGTVDGEEIVMMFVSGPPTPAGITGKRPVKELKSFAKVLIRAGETVKVNLPLAIQDLRHWEGDAKGRNVIDNGDYKIMVGPNAKDLPLTTTVNVHD